MSKVWRQTPHTILHPDDNKPAASSEVNFSTDQTEYEAVANGRLLKFSGTVRTDAKVDLSMAIVRVHDSWDELQVVRVLLDSGS